MTNFKQFLAILGLIVGGVGISTSMTPGTFDWKAVQKLGTDQVLKFQQKNEEMNKSLKGDTEQVDPSTEEQSKPVPDKPVNDDPILDFSDQNDPTPIGNCTITMAELKKQSVILTPPCEVKDGWQYYRVDNNTRIKLRTDPATGTLIQWLPVND